MTSARTTDAKSQRLHPKLRMVVNGDTEVNTARAARSSSVAVDAETPTSIEGPVRPPKRRTRATRKLKRRADARLSVFIQLADQDDLSGLPHGSVVKGAVATAELSAADAFALRENRNVAFAELGQPLVQPEPVVAKTKPAMPASTLRRFGSRSQHKFGEEVLIGLIDVGGFDFAHPDFRDRGGKTRFLRIWDQGGTTRDPPSKRGQPYDYGSELMAEDLNRAIKAGASPRYRLPAYELEPQSTMNVGSHGTHVASIAAGNRGVCREARIVAVLISQPRDELERQQSFYDSTRLVHAVDYLLAVAEKEKKPIAINISLGTNGHAHDDSSPVSRWIDASLTKPGRCVCVAAGNAGQERAAGEGDIGWIMGRVHASGRVGARELASDIEWTVVGNGAADISENELEIWYGPQDRFSVQVKPPGGAWTERVQPGQFIENRPLANGTFLSVYNELYHPANGSNLIGVYLSPPLDEPGVGVTAGDWLVRLHGEEVRDGSYHCWIERDDPRPRRRVGDTEEWAFPSFFGESSFVDSSTVSSLACGRRIVSVANLDADERRINITSSQGPTRDGREKPDVAAPGTEIVAANGFAGEKDLWVAMSGTSMASPFITGLAGLMLGVNATLTAAQVEGILRRTARPLPGTDFRWRNDSGAGAVDPDRCLEEAAAIGKRTELR